jgi:hypothetical protein
VFFSETDNACPKEHPVPYSNGGYCCTFIEGTPVDSSTTKDEIDNGTLMIHNSNV